VEEEIIAESYDEPSKVKKQPDFANKKSNCNNLHFNNNLSIYLKIILIIRSQPIESISWMHKILLWKVRREEIPTEFDNGEETYSNAKDLPASTKLDRSTRYKHVKSHLKYSTKPNISIDCFYLPGIGTIIGIYIQTTFVGCHRRVQRPKSNNPRVLDLNPNRII
jgi:hypothetical protein